MTNILSGIIRKHLFVPSSIPKEDEDYSVEYSFALEYQGPPVSCDIPQAAPMGIGRIPTAKTVPVESLLQDMSLPIVQPIEETDFDKKMSKEIVTPVDGVGSSNQSLSLDSYASCRSYIAVDSSIGSERMGDLSIDRLSDEKNVSGELDSSYIHVEKHEISPAEITAEPTSDDLDDESSEYAESVLTSQSPAVEDIPQEVEEIDDESPRHQRKVSVVTFRDPESGDFIEEDSVSYESGVFPVKEKAEKNDRRGVCYRCLKGNRFTEKVICIVCDAKFCHKCVLRAMGSMPEGRKCVTCTGFRINEPMRGTLGKNCRILKKLLTEAQVKQIMSDEVSCAANQLPSKLVTVNDKPLCQEELVLLRSCPNPPKKLTPGYYWYDKVSGLWGKNGEKPSQIITPQLNVGGYMQREASNGNTQIRINNREITKEESWMLKLAGIPCEGNPHFWVTEDGSYKEEGQKDFKGKLWEKWETRLFCAIMSLPVPPDSKNSSEEAAENIFEQSILYKLLLLGFSKSGTSTIFKQAKLIYNVPFTDEERKTMKLIIQSKLYMYLGTLLEGCQQFEEEILKGKGKGLLIDDPSTSGRGDQRDKPAYSISPRLQAFSDWLLKVIVSGNLEAMTAAAREYAPLVALLWQDPAIQNTYNRRNELAKLPRLATYFLERAVEVSKDDYEPSDMDILYAEGYTTSNRLAFMEFSCPETEHSDRNAYPQSQLHQISRYQLIRVNPKSLGGNCKWLEKFEDINMVLFCVSLTDYDEFVEDSDGILINKMLASKQLFESIVTYPGFDKKDFLLVLNKYDLLEEKIEQVPLTHCEWFHDFNPVTSHNPNSNTTGNPTPSLAQRAFHYIAVKFKRLFHSLTERKLFVSPVTGLEQDSVDECLKYAREIMKWQEEEVANNINEESSTSIEASSS